MQAVSDDMMTLIRDEIARVEVQENVKVIFAVESGSRAWGFHSEDSDYDVRFVYARPLDWHFKLGSKRDVIEYPISGDLDISGWELGKALGLTMGSNAVIAEWLQSPIVYVSQDEACNTLLNFAKRALTQQSVSWHYLSLLRRQQSRLYGPDGGIKLKRFFYILRPALALRWMRLHNEAVPPMNMWDMVEDCELDNTIHASVIRLTEQKKQATERHETAEIDPVLQSLVQSEVEQAENWLKAADKPNKAALRQEADQLHMDLTLKVFGNDT